MMHTYPKGWNMTEPPPEAPHPFAHLPTVPTDLLSTIEANFPDKLPPLKGSTLETLRIAQGERAVVQWLRDIHDFQKSQNKE